MRCTEILGSVEVISNPAPVYHQALNPALMQFLPIFSQVQSIFVFHLSFMDVSLKSVLFGISFSQFLGVYYRKFSWWFHGGSNLNNYPCLSRAPYFWAASYLSSRHQHSSLDVIWSLSNVAGEPRFIFQWIHLKIAPRHVLCDILWQGRSEMSGLRTFDLLSQW